MNTPPPNPITMLAMQTEPAKLMQRMQDIEQGETELGNVVASLHPEQIISISEKIDDIAKMSTFGESSEDLAIIALCTIEGYRRALASVAQRATDIANGRDD